MVVVFQEESTILRFRFGERYKCGKLEKLDLDTNKLSKKDGFLIKWLLKSLSS